MPRGKEGLVSNMDSQFGYEFCIERYFKGYNEVKRWWLPNLQLWYVFFYEKKGGKVRGVLGKDRTKDLIRSIL